MKTLCARAHVGPYTPHQLRHSFVTNLLRSGVPIHLVSRMANHSSTAITMRYVKAGASELREWMGTALQ
jgi:site-specific recombinase XerD